MYYYLAASLKNPRIYNMEKGAEKAYFF